MARTKTAQKTRRASAEKSFKKLLQPAKVFSWGDLRNRYHPGTLPQCIFSDGNGHGNVDTPNPGSIVAPGPSRATIVKVAIGELIGVNSLVSDEVASLVSGEVAILHSREVSYADSDEYITRLNSNETSVSSIFTAGSSRSSTPESVEVEVAPLVQIIATTPVSPVHALQEQPLTPIATTISLFPPDENAVEVALTVETTVTAPILTVNGYQEQPVAPVTTSIPTYSLDDYNEKKRRIIRAPAFPPVCMVQKLPLAPIIHSIPVYHLNDNDKNSSNLNKKTICILFPPSSSRLSLCATKWCTFPLPHSCPFMTTWNSRGLHRNFALQVHTLQNFASLQLILRSPDRSRWNAHIAIIIGLYSNECPYLGTGRCRDMLRRLQAAVDGFHTGVVVSMEEVGPRFWPKDALELKMKTPGERT